MSHVSRLLGAAVAAVFIIGGSVALAVSDGPPAYRIGSTAFSQDELDAELEALATNEVLAELIAQGGGEPLSIGAGSVTSDLGASWIGLRIVQEVARREVARQDLDITSLDRSVGRTFAVQSVGGDEVFQSLPREVQRDLDRRWLAVAVIDREHAECASGYVSHILVETEEEAQDIATRLASGADFEGLAKRFSGDPGSASNGGHLGCLDELGDLDPDFLSATEELEPGTASDPVQTQFGFHLILVNDEHFALTPSNAALDALLARARNVDVEVNPKYGTWDRANGQVLPPGVSASG